MAAENATYAIVKTGGKQYKVAVGDIVKVEKLESEPGSSVSLQFRWRAVSGWAPCSAISSLAWQSARIRYHYILRGLT